jgi:hypothetical protein
MSRTRNGLLIAAVLLALVATGCGGGGPSEQELAKDAERTRFQETHQELSAHRQELSDLQEAVALAATEEVAEEEAAEEVEGEAMEPVEDPAARLSALENEVAALTEDYTGRLVGLLNADPMIEGEPSSERQLALLAMKSDEDIVLAQEWIVKGGDYKQAIGIYNTALKFDPDNANLQAALADAKTNRYMSTERFSQVKKGMTEADIRQLLGQANLHNVRKYEDRGVTAWFYPTSEKGEAAAVWFQPDKKTNVMTVYQVKFEAVKPGQSAEE